MIPFRVFTRCARLSINCSSLFLSLSLGCRSGSDLVTAVENAARRQPLAGMIKHARLIAGCKPSTQRQLSSIHGSEIRYRFRCTVVLT